MKITLQDGTVITTDENYDVIGKAPDGNVGQRLLAFCITSMPDVGAYPDSYRAPAMYTLLRGISSNLPHNLADLHGYHAQLMDRRGNIYGWAVPIERVEA